MSKIKLERTYIRSHVIAPDAAGVDKEYNFTAELEYNVEDYDIINIEITSFDWDDNRTDHDELMEKAEARAEEKFSSRVS